MNRTAANAAGISPARLTAAAVALSAVSAAARPAAASNWLNASGGTWSDPTNWSAGVPTADVPAVFNTSSGAAYTVALPAGEQADGLSFLSDAVTLNTGAYGLNGYPAGLSVTPAAGRTASLTVVGTGGGGNLQSYTAWTIGVGGTVNLPGGSYGTGSVGGLTDAGTLNASAAATRNFPSLDVAGTATLAGGCKSSPPNFVHVGNASAGTGGAGGATLSLTGGSSIAGGTGMITSVGSAVTYAGAGTAAAGTVTVDAGSLTADQAFVGFGTGSVGTLGLSGGAKLSATLTVGAAGGAGTFAASGAGTAATCTNFAAVGGAGTGRLTLTAGATLLTVTVPVGYNGGSGTVALSGTGTALTASTLAVGASPVFTYNGSTGTYTTSSSAAGTGSVTLDTGATIILRPPNLNGPSAGLLVYPTGRLTLASAAAVGDGGAYNQAGGTLGVELAATAPVTAPLTVAGATTLGGTLALTRAAGVTLNGTDRRLVVAANGTLTGTFATVTGQQQSPTSYLYVSYAAHGVYVGVAPVGDATLDDAIDGSDYARIDAGYLSQRSATPLAGWTNGDFNGDGRIDASDYTLIDNAFNTQPRPAGSSVVAGSTDEVAAIGTTAVPEPASAVLSAAGLAAALVRRSRRP